MITKLALRGLFALIAVIVLLACEPEIQDPGARTFLIRKGEHYSTPRLVEALQTDRFIFRATFDKSAIYDLGDRFLQSNKNKLMGFSDCNGLHQDNSARFAWQWFDNKLEIYAYCYVNGQRVEAFVGEVMTGEENTYEIRLTDTEYIFLLNGEQKAVVGRSSNCSKGIYYLLYPYFGGSVPAPADVTIRIARNL